MPLLPQRSRGGPSSDRLRWFLSSCCRRSSRLCVRTWVVRIECALVFLRMRAFGGRVAPIRHHRAAVAQTRAVTVPTCCDAFYPANDGKGFRFSRFLAPPAEKFSAEKAAWSVGPAIICANDAKEGEWPGQACWR